MITVAAMAVALLATPPPGIPPYVPPLVAMDGAEVPHAPAPEVRDGGSTVCYTAGAHLRLSLALTLAEPLSTDRARLAWTFGRLAGIEEAAEAYDGEHGARLEAAARAEAQKLRADFLAEQAGAAWWTTAAWVAGGVTIGALLGAAGWEIARE